MLTKQYDELIKSYQRCFSWNNLHVTKKDLDTFMSLYLKTPLWYRKDTRNQFMFRFSNFKLSSKLIHKRNRILKKYLCI